MEIVLNLKKINKDGMLPEKKKATCRVIMSHKVIICSSIIVRG